MQMDEIESFFKEVYQEQDQESANTGKTTHKAGRTGGFIISASYTLDSAA